jgi:hypothetical protein
MEMILFNMMGPVEVVPLSVKNASLLADAQRRLAFSLALALERRPR